MVKPCAAACWRVRLAWLSIIVGAILIGACDAERNGNVGVERIQVWAHAGREAERRTLERQIALFEARHPTVTVELTFIPEGSYNGQVQAAALAGQLPDLLELDGPYMAAYAWRGWLAPLSDRLPPELLADLLPSLIDQGTWRGTLYALGQFDSGLGLWADRRVLDAVGARIPDHPSEAWSLEEFEALLERLAERDPDRAAGLLAFLLAPDRVLAISAANGAVPGACLRSIAPPIMATMARCACSSRNCVTVTRSRGPRPQPIR